MRRPDGTRRVVVTGYAPITPIGITREDYWTSLAAGRSGVRPLTRLDSSAFRTRIAATIEDFDAERFIERKQIKRMDRFSHLAIAASQLAVEHSGLDATDPEVRAKTGVILGSAVAGIISHEVAASDYYTRGHRYVNPFTVPLVMFNAGPSNVCMHLGFTGVSYAVSTACASSNHAVGEAYQKIRHGHAEVLLAGGSDAPVSPVCFSAWDKLRAMSTRNDDPEGAVRPFSKDRDGLVMGEGAGMLVLESLEHARARGARIHAEVMGYGTSTDAYHLTYPNGEQEVRALRQALGDAGLTPSDVDYINAHGTATLANDKVETAAIKEVFGEHAAGMPVSSTKSMVGHPLGASGAVELIACIEAMSHGFIPPTINLAEPDPECDLDYVPNAGRAADVNVAVSNSFGFGGNNAIIVIGKWRRESDEEN